ncbi:MAG: iron hydrogenase [Candidatus Komeilibacteria bacterium]|jgi:riboflavin transporter|nr:iron hydrogenase [Candidatus Komeilibacteria bacterium]MBT4447819.1 iron hydrogenase [Candidatus Komeilibacteria bacterium]
MALTQTLTWDRAKTAATVQFVSLLSIATIAPLFHQQWVTGPIVNAMFLIAVVLLGSQNAIILALLPSTIALGVGLLPAVLAPMIPFIIISNVILILGFHLLRDKNFWLGIVVGSLLKFIFLWSTSFVVINLLLKQELATKVSAMMSWPQLATALIGGLLAYAFLKGIKKI